MNYQAQNGVNSKLKINAFNINYNLMKETQVNNLPPRILIPEPACALL